MLGQLGAMELLLILVIVLLVFGVDRVGKLGRELGEGVRGFREGIEAEGSDTADGVREGIGDEDPVAEE